MIQAKLILTVKQSVVMASKCDSAMKVKVSSSKKKFNMKYDISFLELGFTWCGDENDLRLYLTNTESFMYYARQQTAVARGLAWPARRFTGRQTAAARKHSLCFFSSVSE